MNASRNIILTACAAIALNASAAPLEFVIQPGVSTMDLTIEIDLGALGGDSDADSTTLSGFISAMPDDAIAPADIALYDFQAMMDSDLEFSWVPAFLSTASATLSGGLVEYAEPGTIIGPVVITGSSTFEFLEVPILLSGTLDVNYNIFLVGSGSQSIDLSTLGSSVTPISGVLTQSPGTLTITNTIAFGASQPLVVEGSEVGTVNVTGTATMVAIAQVPDCPADFTGDGELDFFDISAFLTAYSAQDPSADFTNDNAWDFFDISAFLTAYSAGCP